LRATYCPVAICLMLYVAVEEWPDQAFCQAA
jgi:hypothetical protein